MLMYLMMAINGENMDRKWSKTAFIQEVITDVHIVIVE
ncbi:hypothetical protein ACJIZ3_016284 [Penstemon smallii]|uniref:Uncharacterized protein n=1 Tax=Penstemon smallii TaxID=265156 RepID=A0ABD3RSR6_9LAMI